MIPFDKYNYLKFKDLESCPFVFYTEDARIWMINDDRRMLLIALDRYADELQRVEERKSK